MKQDALDSATSYTVGGLGFAMAHLVEAATAAQAVTVILACIVVAVRLIHDSVKLYRYWKNRGE